MDSLLTDEAKVAYGQTGCNRSDPDLFGSAFFLKVRVIRVEYPYDEDRHHKVVMGAISPEKTSVHLSIASRLLILVMLLKLRGGWI